MTNLPENSITAKPPYLPPIDKKYLFTLILDLDETLVHYVEVILYSGRK
jgi:hypothetical protein